MKNTLLLVIGNVGYHYFITFKFYRTMSYKCYWRPPCASVMFSAHLDSVSTDARVVHSKLAG